MTWVSPTGYNDPGEVYYNPTNAYDGSTSTAATCLAADYGNYLELTIAAISCDKIRLYADAEATNPDVDIDVYYSSAWHNIFSGEIAFADWVEKAIGTTETVTAARVKCNLSDKGFDLYELEFNDITPVAAGRSFGFIIG